jgi:hypothetical protein
VTAERQSQPKTQAPDREQRAAPSEAQPELELLAAEPGTSAAGEGIFRKALAGDRAGESHTIARHSAALSDPRLAQRGSAGERARLMRQLQRGYGNGHVARVVAQVQAPAQHAQGAPAEEHAVTPAEAQSALPAVAEAIDTQAEHPAATVAPSPAAPVSPAAPTAAAPTVQRLWNPLPALRDGILGKIAGWAANSPGYYLLTLILGKDPISDQVVERTPKNVFHAALSLVPGGNLLFENLDQSGAIDKAFAWLEEQWAQLGLSWDAIKGLFKRAWDSLSRGDLLDPGGAWDKLKTIFTEPIARVKNFLFSIGNKILEFIFEGVMEGLGGGMVMNLLKRAGGAFGAIVKDPIGFLGNLIGGVKQGLQGFVSRIGAHLKKGLIGWLFGEVAQTGIELPKTFDLKGILSLVMQVLGLTWANVRGQAVKVLGEGVVGRLEQAFGIFKIIKDEGIGGLWEYIKEQVGNLKDMVLDGIKEMVASQVIQAGVQWLLGMLGGPAGALIKAIKAIYDVVMWFVNNGSRLAALVNSIMDSIGAIAGGAVGQAAQFIENSLASAIPMVIGFLANLLGLGNLGSKIKAIIEKIQSPIQKAIGWVLGKAKGFASKIMGKVKGAFGKKDRPDRPSHATAGAAETAAAVAAEQLLSAPDASPESVRAGLPSIKNKYRLTSINLIAEGDQNYHITTLINRTNTKTKKLTKKGIVNITLERPDKWRARLLNALRDDSDYADLHKQRRKKALLLKGYARRHIMPIQDLIDHYHQVLNNNLTYDQAAKKLEGTGLVAVGKPLSNDKILSAAKKLVREFYNDYENLMVGEFNENSALQNKLDKPINWSIQQLAGHVRIMKNKYFLK